MLDCKRHFMPGKSPLFEIRRLDAEASNTSRSSQSNEEGHVKVSEGKSQLLKAKRVDAETKNSSKSTQLTEQDHVGDAKVTVDKIEQIKIELDHKEKEDYYPQPKKVGSNVFVSRKTYPLYVYTYKVLNFLASIFILFFLAVMDLSLLPWL